MRVGQVIGSLWATRKDEEALNGLKLLVVQPLHINSGKEGARLWRWTGSVLALGNP